MAQPKNRQQFVELEYCFEQYFNKNFAPIVNREYNELNKKQLEEYSRTLDRHQASVGMYGGASTAALMAYQEHKTVGEWGSKSSDYLLEECNKKFSADPKVQEDLSKMVIACRATLVSELGTEKYKEMSAGTPTGDLANFYVCNRFITLFMEQLAKKEMPKGALDYIMKKGVADSLPGLLVGCTMKSSDMDKQIKDMSEKFYNPSGGEKAAAFGMSFLLDAASTGGYGSAGKAATWLAMDGGLHLVGSVIPKDKSFDQMMGEAVWGNGKAIDGIRADSKKVNPQSSEDITTLNSMLNKQLYRPKFDEKEANALCAKLMGSVGQENGKGLVRGLESGLKTTGVEVRKDTAIPKWMESKTDEELYRYACYWSAMAMEMKVKGVKLLHVNGKNYTAEQLGQKGYDYARALEASQKRSRAEQQSQTNTQQRQQSTNTPQIGQSMYVAQSVQNTQIQGQGVQQVMQGQQQTVVGQQIQQHSAVSQTSQQVAGWGGLFDQMGLGGFGEVGKNLGYVLAMLPDMLIGMFTGKTKSLKFGDNLMPIASIIAGMFIKNPLLKMLLIGFGGANLLNKAGHEALERRDGGQSQTVRQYRQYSDEVLNSRIKQPAMKGNTLIATIDNVPSVITINEEAADAYYKGAIPLNTLANAVLRKYDEQKEALEENYERQVAESNTEERSRGLK